MKKVYGCWLHLSKKDEKKLLPIIKRLSNKYDKGDMFPPHISVNDSALMELDEVIKVANDCIKGIRKFKVEKDSIKYSDKWLKTLYIQIKDNPNLSIISKRLNNTFRPDKSAYQLNPHISLMYKSGLDNNIKKELAQNIVVPSVYGVLSVAVVTVDNPNRSKDYGDWKIVYEKELI